MKSKELKGFPAIGPKTKLIVSAIALSLGAGTVLAGTTTGNNFTMLIFGANVDGTNDIDFTWDGTLNTNVATAVSNASMVSALPQAFFGSIWTAYNVKIYGPGNYTISTADTPGGPGCPSNAPICAGDGSTGAPGTYNVTVAPGQIMGHMKFAWSTSQGIDVVNVWNLNAVFAPNSMHTGPAGTGSSATVWSFMSSDWDSDGTNGAGMVDGPFGNYSANFNVMLNTTSPSNFPFFTNQSNVPASTLTTSSPITVTGTDSTSTEVYVISVTNGAYSIDGGAYTSTSGTVIEGQAVRVRNTSSANPCAQVGTSLNVGGTSRTFTTTTAGVDCTDARPDSFPFTPQPNVARSTVVESNPITVLGIDGLPVIVAISITGGDYQVNGQGAYSSATSTVSLGDTVKVRHTSASGFEATTSTVLTIGSGVDGNGVSNAVSETFTSTTAASPTVSVTAAETSKISSCSISSTPVNATDRADWWLVAGFLAWLGAWRIRFRRQAQS